MNQLHENHRMTSLDRKADVIGLSISYTQADPKLSGLHWVEHYHAEQ